MLASKLIHYFSNQPLGSGLQHSQITSHWILPIEGWSESFGFPTAWGSCSCHSQHRAAHFSHQSCPFWYHFFFTDSEGVVILFQKCVKYFMNILDYAMSKWVGNSAHILAHVYNSASRQCHEVWASQFSFLHSLKDMFPPSETCLYGCINWSLPQAQQQGSMACLSLFPTVRGGRSKSRAGFCFKCVKETCVRV